MQEGEFFSWGAGRADRDVGRHEEDGYGTGFGRERRKNRGSSGRAEEQEKGEGFLAPDNSLPEETRN